MRLLLDTHVLIWLIDGDDSLSSAAKQAIDDEANSLYLSIASLWEIAIKMSLGKLQLEISLEQAVENFIIPGGIEILPIHLHHLLALRYLSLHHRDPFDRLLICQSQVEKLILVSGDRAFGDYSVQILW
jgi:PIN domain nuclease of toxin-antitoxin system